MTKPKYEYKSVPMRTAEDLSKAEALLDQGWKLINVGIYTGQFERPVF